MPPTRQRTPQASAGEAIETPLAELYLDPKNPRLASESAEGLSQDEILRVLWEERAVNELVDSIAVSGYWWHEELFATREGGRLVVIEGNRRLAAVKLLADPALCRRLDIKTVPHISEAARAKLATLPVVICAREAVWQYIGFKHVNGPQDWDSIAKAEYIARVHGEFGVPLDEISRTIGDRHDTVRRLYRGLMVLNQAKATGSFDVDDRFNTRFAYSHLWTGLGYDKIQKFLGLTPEGGFGPDPVPPGKVERLRELCLWLYGSKSDNRPPVIKSQNPDLRKLDEVLGEKDGVAALRSGLPLDTALNAGRGDARLLREALVLAEQKLKEARGCVPNGFKAEDADLLDKARHVLRIAETIVDDMEATRPGRARDRRGRAAE